MFQRLIVNGDTTDHRGSVSALSDGAKVGEFNEHSSGKPDGIFQPE